MIFLKVAWRYLVGTIEFKEDETNVNKLKWIIARQKENREIHMSHPLTNITEEKTEINTKEDKLTIPLLMLH